MKTRTGRLPFLIPARSSSAIQKRTEQLKRWQQSETNKELSDFKEKRRKVAFQDDCVFLAACAAGEREDVVRMLSRGSDINTANVDGLTALHQVRRRETLMK